MSRGNTSERGTRQGEMGSVVNVEGVDVKGAVSYSGVGENVVVGVGWKVDLKGVEVGSVCKQHRCERVW